MGQKLTLKEQMRRNQRVLKKAIRDVDREKTKLERQQKKLVSDIKKLAKQGQMVSYPANRTSLSKIKGWGAISLNDQRSFVFSCAFR